MTTNFVWVYPFTGPFKDPGDHLVGIHDSQTWEFPSALDVDADQLGAYVQHSTYYVYNMDCDLLDRDYIGLGKPVPLSPGSGDPLADDARALDPNTPIDSGADSC